VGHDVARSVDVPRQAILVRDSSGSSVVRYPSLGAAVTKEWRASGAHAAPTDVQRDEAVLHTADDTPFSEMIAVMDAIAGVKRPLVHGDAPAFALTLATQ
jgi:hypothetical protein